MAPRFENCTNSTYPCGQPRARLTSGERNPVPGRTICASSVCATESTIAEATIEVASADFADVTETPLSIPSGTVDIGSFCDGNPRGSHCVRSEGLAVTGDVYATSCVRIHGKRLSAAFGDAPLAIDAKPVFWAVEYLAVPSQLFVAGERYVCVRGPYSFGATQVLDPPEYALVRTRRASMLAIQTLEKAALDAEPTMYVRSSAGCGWGHWVRMDTAPFALV